MVHPGISEQKDHKSHCKLGCGPFYKSKINSQWGKKKRLKLSFGCVVSFFPQKYLEIIELHLYPIHSFHSSVLHC